MHLRSISAVCSADCHRCQTFALGDSISFRRLRRRRDWVALRHRAFFWIVVRFNLGSLLLLIPSAWSKRPRKPLSTISICFEQLIQIHFAQTVLISCRLFVFCKCLHLFENFCEYANSLWSLVSLVVWFSPSRWRKSILDHLFSDCRGLSPSHPQISLVSGDLPRLMCTELNQLDWLDLFPSFSESLRDFLRIHPRLSRHREIAQEV